ncbi:hypothetical protein OKW96_16590 [Sphingobacterium sp. KU25419]|nr:hypothetical protein OKW96_16590 [Sphingobacterium sp. KU25419]
MFNVFKGKTRNYKVIKAFKKVDLKQALEIDMLDIISFVQKEIDSLGGKGFDYYELNYGAQKISNYNQLLKVIKRKNDIFQILATDEINSNVLLIDNQVLNSKANVKEGLITFHFALDLTLFNVEFVQGFLISLYKLVDFDYAYLVDLDSNYDITTERKFKKGIFGINAEVNEEDIKWNQNAWKIKEGFLKKVYLFNVLNNSQLNNNAMQFLISSKVGELKNLNENLSIWTIRSDELPYASES